MANVHNVHRSMPGQQASSQPQQQQPPAMSSARLTELLDAVKNEFESVVQDTSIFRLQRDEFEVKIGSQISEMNQIQQNVFELERAHQKMKMQYEEEILRLRRELESRGIVPPIALSNGGGASGLAPSLSGGNPGLFGSAAGAQTQLPASNGATGTYSGPPLSSTAPLPTLAGNNNQGSGGDTDDMRNARLQSMSAAGYNFSSAGKQFPPSLPAPNAPFGGQQHPGHLQPLQQQRNANSMPAASSKIATVFGDVDVDSIPASMKKEGGDWLTLFNPKSQRTMDTRLVHSLDHSSVVCCVRFSTDGKLLATGCNRSTQIYDVATGARIALLTDDGGKDADLYIRSVCFSPDGTFLATGAEDKQIRLWNIKTRTVQAYFTGHEQDIYSLDFSADGKLIVSGSGDRTAKVWSVETGKCMFTLGNDEVGPKDAGVTSVAICPEGKLIAAGSLDRIVRIWDAKTGQFMTRLDGHKDSVYSVAFSPNGRLLVSGSLDKTLKVWDLDFGVPNNTLRATCRGTFSGHKDFVLSVAFSADGQTVLSGSKDRFVHVWDHKSGQLLLMMQGHKNSVISVATSPAGTLFATGSGDCRARIWAIEPWSPTTYTAPESSAPR